MGYEGHPHGNGREERWSERERRMRDRNRGGQGRWEGGGGSSRWVDRGYWEERTQSRGGHWEPRGEPMPRQTRPSMRTSPRTMIEVESEKEFVDLIVDCVSEQVRRIVRDEVQMAFGALLDELRRRR